MTDVTANGNTYSDDGSQARDMTNGGHRDYLLPMLSDVMVEISTLRGFGASSTTSLAIGTGEKTFTATPANASFVAGMMVKAVSAADATNYMVGSVTSWSGGSLVVDVTLTGGSGTYADWVIGGYVANADPLTTRGDMLIRNASNVSARLAIGAAGTAPVSDGTDLAYAGIVKQGTHSIFVPAGALRPTTSNGCAALAAVETTAGRPDLIGLAFDGASDEHAQFQVVMPKSWNEGTITFRVHWWSTATDTDGVAWALQGVAVSDGDTADVAYGTAIVVTDAAQSTSEDIYVTDTSAAVTIAGTPAAGDIVFFRAFRDVSDAADTMSEDAILLGITILFTVNSADDS